MFWRTLPPRRFISLVCIRHSFYSVRNICINNKFHSHSISSCFNRLYSSKSENKNDLVSFSDSNLKNDRYIAVFTCNICNHRSAKSFSKQAYNHGIVYVRCESCKNLHLISDQLGWFGDKQNIEEILAQKGHQVSKMELGEDVPEGDLELISGLRDNKYFKE